MIRKLEIDLALIEDKAEVITCVLKLLGPYLGRITAHTLVHDGPSGWPYLKVWSWDEQALEEILSEYMDGEEHDASIYIMEATDTERLDAIRARQSILIQELKTQHRFTDEMIDKILK